MGSMKVRNCVVIGVFWNCKWSIIIFIWVMDLVPSLLMLVVKLQNKLYLRKYLSFVFGLMGCTVYDSSEVNTSINSISPLWRIYVSMNRISIGSANGLSPIRRQAIIWTNAGILLIVTLGSSFSEILIEIHNFAFNKMHLQMSSGKWRHFVWASMC